MILMTKAQSHELDARAGSYGLSGSDLMDKAGSQTAQWLLKTFPSSSFCIFCGPGHNGGDGWTLAFYLKKAGRRVDVFSCESSNALFNEKKRNAESLNLRAQNFNQWTAQKGQILVDALFGVGLSRPLEGTLKETALKINKASQTVVALDVPSGLCADRGCVVSYAIQAEGGDSTTAPTKESSSCSVQADYTNDREGSAKGYLSCAVQADYTLSLALAKPGFYLNEGPKHCGRVFVFPIGFPQELLNKTCHSVFLAEKQEAGSWLPSYKNTANKSHRGHALIVAGRRGMWGCGLLAARSAYTVGSGYVTWAGASYPYEESVNVPEALLSRLDEKNLFEKKTAVGAGPGLGFSKEAEQFILQLVSLPLPAVLDADAISFLGKGNFPRLNKNFLLTPHAGELARRLGISSSHIDKDRLLYAKEGANKTGAWLLLKGFYPVLSDGERTWIIPSGSQALGKAGSGDVLTGMITGLLAQGLPIFKACVLAVFLQGESARRWVEKGRDINSFSASDIIQEMAFVMSEMRPSA